MIDDSALDVPVRHKQILTVAEKNPEASLEEIAEEVPSATTDLVERVLDKHGDPVAEETEQSQSKQTEEEAASTDHGSPDFDDLTAKQQQTLQAIYNQPEATQQEIAEILDVTPATISNRISNIEGIEWETRAAAVKEIFDDESSSESSVDTDNQPEQLASDGTGQQMEIEQLAERLASLESRVEELAEQSEQNSLLNEVDFLHKIVHACMQYDDITEEEERELLRVVFD